MTHPNMYVVLDQIGREDDILNRKMRRRLYLYRLVADDELLMRTRLWHQQARDFVRRDSLTEEIALPLRASLRFETGQLIGSFDTFSCDVQPKPLCKSKDGLDDHQTLLIRRDVENEALIDLYVIEWK